MHHPFIETSGLSEDELLSKITELSRKLIYARNMVGDVSMIISLEGIIDAYQAEYQERLNKRMHEQWTKQFPEVIESDPEFKKGKDGKSSSVISDGSPRPAFNKKFVKMPGVDITPVPTRHAPKPTNTDEEDS